MSWLKIVWTSNKKLESHPQLKEWAIQFEKIKKSEIKFQKGLWMGYGLVSLIMLMNMNGKSQTDIGEGVTWIAFMGMLMVVQWAWHESRLDRVKPLKKINGACDDMLKMAESKQGQDARIIINKVQEEERELVQWDWEQARVQWENKEQWMSFMESMKDIQEIVPSEMELKSFILQKSQENKKIEARILAGSLLAGGVLGGLSVTIPVENINMNNGGGIMVGLLATAILGGMLGLMMTYWRKEIKKDQQMFAWVDWESKEKVNIRKASMLKNKNQEGWKMLLEKVNQNPQAWVTQRDIEEALILDKKMENQKKCMELHALNVSELEMKTKV